eukprot:scaffold70938_cov62-Phaeocystis_antarctica.AAC.6
MIQKAPPLRGSHPGLELPMTPTTVSPPAPAQSRRPTPAGPPRPRGTGCARSAAPAAARSPRAASAACLLAGGRPELDLALAGRADRWRAMWRKPLGGCFPHGGVRMRVSCSALPRAACAAARPSTSRTASSTRAAAARSQVASSCARRDTSAASDVTEARAPARRATLAASSACASSRARRCAAIAALVSRSASTPRARSAAAVAASRAPSRSDASARSRSSTSRISACISACTSARTRAATSRSHSALSSAATAASPRAAAATAVALAAASSSWCTRSGWNSYTEDRGGDHGRVERLAAAALRLVHQQGKLRAAQGVGVVMVILDKELVEDWLGTVGGAVRREAGRDARQQLQHQRRSLDAAPAHGESGERREAELLLVRILREPAQLGALIGEAHRDLKDDAALARTRVLNGHVAVERGGHEAELDATLELSAGHAAVDRLARAEESELGERRGDHVQGGHVAVAEAELLEAGLEEGHLAVHAAQHRVILHEARPRVEPRANELLVSDLGVQLAQSLVERGSLRAERAQRQRRAAAVAHRRVLAQLDV